MKYSSYEKLSNDLRMSNRIKIISLQNKLLDKIKNDLQNACTASGGLTAMETRMRDHSIEVADILLIERKQIKIWFEMVPEDPIEPETIPGNLTFERIAPAMAPAPQKPTSGSCYGTPDNWR